MNSDRQTDRPDRSVTIAFRTSEHIKHLVRAAAARRDEFPSEWLRRAVRDQLEREHGSAVEPQSPSGPGE